MKVLILHQHFKTPQSGGAIRSYYLAKALVERGVETVVITGGNERASKQESVEGITVHYLPVPYDNRFGFRKRVWSFLQFVRRAIRAARQYRDADLCYAISTPLTTGLAAMMIKSKYGMPYIFEVGDLWPDAPVQMGFVRNALIKNLLYRMEQSIYDGAESIVALSEPIRNIIVKKAPAKSVHVLPNMSDTAFFRPEQKHPVLVRKFGVEGKFVVSYIGAIGVANGLRYFLDAAAASQREKSGVHFILCGQGAMTDDLKAYAAELNLSNLSILAFQDRNGVREIMNITDANFVSYLPVKILETGSPNKYFDGLAAGKLTIVNFSGWVREEIEKEQCGIYVDPGDPGDFVRKIKPFKDEDQLLRNYQRAGRILAEERYPRVKLSEAFLKVIL